MNHLYDLDSFETIESMVEQIEQDYIVPENDKAVIIKLLEEYFSLKENDEPSKVPAKWSEISKLLDTFDMKVKQ